MSGEERHTSLTTTKNEMTNKEINAKMINFGDTKQYICAHTHTHILIVAFFVFRW